MRRAVSCGCVSYGRLHGALATLVVTRSKRDHVKIRNKSYASVCIIVIRLNREYFGYFRMGYYWK